MATYLQTMLYLAMMQKASIDLDSLAVELLPAHLQRLLFAFYSLPLLFHAGCGAAVLLLQLLVGGYQPGAGAVQLSTELRMCCCGMPLAFGQRMLLLCLLRASDCLRYSHRHAC